MWKLKNEIPELISISINGYDEIELNHSKGQFKINKNEILEVQFYSDFYSLNSNLGYSSKHSFFLLFQWNLELFELDVVRETSTGILNVFRSLFSLCLCSGLALLVKDIFFEESLRFYFILAVLFFIFFDRFIRMFLVPFLFKTFFGEFIFEDILLIKTSGNKFFFRDKYRKITREHFNIEIEFDDFQQSKKNERKAAKFVFTVLLLVFILTPFFLMNNDLNSLWFGKKVIFTVTENNIYLLSFLKGIWIALIFGLYVFLILIAFILAFVLIVLPLLGVVFAVGFAVGFIEFLTKITQRFLNFEVVFSFQKVSSPQKIILFSLLYIVFGVLNYYLFETVIYQPIKNWVGPFLYAYSVDTFIYLFLIISFSIISLFIIENIIKLIFMPRNKNS